MQIATGLSEKSFGNRFPNVSVLLFAMLLVLAGGCDSLTAPTEEAPLADEVSTAEEGSPSDPAFEWSLLGGELGDKNASAQALTNGESTGAGGQESRFFCAGRVAHSAQGFHAGSKENGRPFRIRLRFSDEARSAAPSDTTGEELFFAVRADTSAESRVLLETRCRIPASDLAREQLVDGIAQVQKELRERLAGDDDSGAITQGGSVQTRGAQSTRKSAADSSEVAQGSSGATASVQKFESNSAALDSWKRECRMDGGYPASGGTSRKRMKGYTADGQVFYYYIPVEVWQCVDTPDIPEGPGDDQGSGGDGSGGSGGDGGDGSSELSPSEKLQRAVESVPHTLLEDWPSYGSDEWDEFYRLSKHTAPQKVLDRLGAFGDLGINSAIQTLEDASGPLVNMDKYSVTVNKDAISGSSEAYFEDQLRKNFPDYVDENLSQFKFFQDGEQSRWESDNPLGTAFSIQLQGRDGFSFDLFDEDGTVLSTEHTSSSFIFSTAFTALKDGQHPVSGNREFGFDDNGDGTVTFYTRGVDRITSKLYESADKGMSWLFKQDNYTFKQGANLWKSLVRHIADDFPSSAVTMEDPIEHRVDWKKVKERFGFE